MYRSCNENQSVCTKCMNIKDKENFIKDKSRKNGLSAQCNECKNKYYSNFQPLWAKDNLSKGNRFIG